MAEPERVIGVVPKAWYNLDEWIIFFTNYRAIVTRFMAYGAASGGILGIVGMAEDDRQRQELMRTDPNLLLSRDRANFEIPYVAVREIRFKSGFIGTTITFTAESGGHTTVFKMDGKSYAAQAAQELSKLLGPKIVNK